MIVMLEKEKIRQEYLSLMLAWKVVKLRRENEKLENKIENMEYGKLVRSTIRK